VLKKNYNSHQHPPLFGEKKYFGTKKMTTYTLSVHLHAILQVSVRIVTNCPTRNGKNIMSALDSTGDKVNNSIKRKNEVPYVCFEEIKNIGSR
jgi:hypothetical protein